MDSCHHTFDISSARPSSHLPEQFHTQQLPLFGENSTHFTQSRVALQQLFVLIPELSNEQRSVVKWYLKLKRNLCMNGWIGLTSCDYPTPLAFVFHMGEVPSQEFFMAFALVLRVESSRKVDKLLRNIVLTDYRLDNSTKQAPSRFAYICLYICVCGVCFAKWVKCKGLVNSQGH